ncbi:restriction endonuclease subunit S [Methylobacterium sp. E-041]|uniref:restriction endonuclease subunit S n=1 Tax=Methylobacterium sp. E-041 TaxID=2836573 RepID=UPI001FBA4A20|nr:restriction endonuclease subunit S [Methylobacterium sp. E-041]MCJ2109029.1 restriction endonuclease subunit S [Methylobacterium sp. E-041]
MNWKVMQLRELVFPTGRQIDPGGTPDHEYNYISLENIEAGTGRLLKMEKTRGREIGSMKISFEKGDILYGRLRPYLQKVVIAPFDGIAATELWPLKTSEAIDPEFLREVLLGPGHRSEVAQLMSGARMPRVRSDQLLDMTITVPPLEEQRLIVRALNVLRHKVEGLRGHLLKGINLFGDYERALLTAAFDGSMSASFRAALPNGEDGEALFKDVLEAREVQWIQVINESLASSRQPSSRQIYIKPAPPAEPNNPTKLPHSWSWMSIDQLTSPLHPLCYGVVQPGDNVEEGALLVRVQDLDEHGINSNNMRRIDPSVDERHARSRVQGGDVLVSLVGTIGRVAVVPDTLAQANIARALAKITPVRVEFSQWIALSLQSPSLQVWLAQSARGVARDTLNLSRLALAPIPIAPLHEMNWLLQNIAHRRTAITALKRKFEILQASLETLWANVLLRVLSGFGELKDPGDQAVAVARRSHIKSSVVQSTSSSGRRRAVTSTKPRPNTHASPKRDLIEVLQEHSDGLEPLRLFGEAGYGLQDVEIFFKVLAAAIDKGELREQRSAEDWPVLMVV